MPAHVRCGSREAGRASDISGSGFRFRGLLLRPESRPKSPVCCWSLLCSHFEFKDIWRAPSNGVGVTLVLGRENTPYTNNYFAGLQIVYSPSDTLCMNQPAEG